MSCLPCPQLFLLSKANSCTLMTTYTPLPLLPVKSSKSNRKFYRALSGLGSCPFIPWLVSNTFGFCESEFIELGVLITGVIRVCVCVCPYLPKWFNMIYDYQATVTICSVNIFWFHNLFSIACEGEDWCTSVLSTVYQAGKEWEGFTITLWQEHSFSNLLYICSHIAVVYRQCTTAHHS